MDWNALLDQRWFWYVVYASPFWMVWVPYAIFRLKGAVAGLLAFCATMGWLFIVYERGIAEATHPQAGGGMLFVQMFMLPAGGAFALCAFVMIWGLDRMINR